MLTFSFSRKFSISITNSALLLLVTMILTSCGNDALVAPKNDIQFLPRLSEYGIFRGTANTLTPTARFVEYSLPAALFSDYSEKQRLIALPAGTSLEATQLDGTNDDLPNFPDRTMLVKTFFYYLDKRAPERGKRIIETRLLVKNGAAWNVATYRWNAEQTDADLITSGFDTSVEWIDGRGTPRTTSYHIPNTRECATCHQSNGTIHPIGPKLRNLNMTVTRNGAAVNQLQYLRAQGMVAEINLLRIGSVPHPTDASVPVQERARAYLDINCSHCHNASGYAGNQGLFLKYATPLHETGLAENKANILARMQNASMPLLGTTLRDEDGIALLTAYFNSLP